MKIKDIGGLTGKVLVFGGVYSNLQALQKMYEIAGKSQVAPDHIICTGDVVGYCAQPDECLRMVKQWGIHLIAGNVELQIRDGDESCGCNFDEGSRCDTFSRQWYPYAFQAVSEEMRNWLQTLPEHLRFTIGDKNGYVLHGGYHDVSEFVFKSTVSSVLEKVSQLTDAAIILAGHSGLPFAQEGENSIWINAGVIGMPANDGTPRVWYAILDGDTGHAELCSFEYDHETAATKMREKGLPLSYAETLKTGIWDNCEILPDEETQLQGHPLQVSTYKMF